MSRRAREVRGSEIACALYDEQRWIGHSHQVEGRTDMVPKRKNRQRCVASYRFMRLGARGKNELVVATYSS